LWIQKPGYSESSCYYGVRALQWFARRVELGQNLEEVILDGGSHPNEFVYVTNISHNRLDEFTFHSGLPDRDCGLTLACCKYFCCCFEFLNLLPLVLNHALLFLHSLND